MGMGWNEITTFLISHVNKTTYKSASAVTINFFQISDADNLLMCIQENQQRSLYSFVMISGSRGSTHSLHYILLTAVFRHVRADENI